MNQPITHWMFAPLRKFATFGGRAPRAEFWWFWLFSVLLIGAATVVDFALIGAEALAAFGVGPLGGLAALALMLPSLAVQVRRLHDQEKSGWFILIGLIPFIGGLILFWFNLQRGTPGTNIYGEDPLETRQFFT
ncbi:MAG: DUF805 domain-containing protein [Polymorphobacter sp.]|uniref:DUF805 domain-containing protein n=1 Tax=Polymorphobacter sp. TaxID=1909290 RepID=UPI003A8853AC